MTKHILFIYVKIKMKIPWQDIDPDTLNNLIEYFVLREGTDYGENEKTLLEKVDDVKSQLRAGSAIVVWSELHETIDIKKVD